VSLTDKPVRASAHSSRHLGSRVIPFIQAMVQVTLSLSTASSSVVRQSFALQSALLDVVPTFIGSKQLHVMLRHAFGGQEGSKEVIASAAKKIPTKTAFPVVMDLWKSVQSESAAVGFNLYVHDQLAHVQVLSGFFDLLRLVLRNADRAALPSLIKPVFAFFLDVFDLRHRLQLKGVSRDSIHAVESSAIGSFLELVTKLNEASFKPLFVRLYDWAVVDLAEGKAVDDGRLIERRTVLIHVMMGLLTKFKVSESRIPPAASADLTEHSLALYRYLAIAHRGIARRLSRWPDHRRATPCAPSRSARQVVRCRRWCLLD
jgi:U3 small nucleolar RNA-associated protein 10